MRARALAFGALVLGVYGCGGSSYAIPPEPEPEPEEPDIDLGTVTWPSVPEVLPEGVPAWAQGFDHEGRVDTRYQPQLHGVAERISRLADQEAGAIGATVLLCSIHSSGGASDPRPIFRSQRRSRADLTVVGSVAGGPEFRASAPNNTRSLAFSVPVPSLSIGDIVRLRLVDRDFLFHDSVGSLSLRYGGVLPFEVEQGPIRGRCHAYDPERTAALTGIALHTLDQAIARLMLRLDEPRGSALVPRARWREFGAVREAFDGLAAYTGWGDERLQLRRARIEALADEEKRAIAERFDALWAEAPPAGEWASFQGGGRARFVELHRPPERPAFGAFEVRVEIEDPPTGTRPIYWIRLHLPTKSTDTHSPEFRHVDGRSLRALVFSHGDRSWVDPLPERALIEVAVGSGPSADRVVLRLELPEQPEPEPAD